MSFKKCRDVILGVVMAALSIFYLYNTAQIKTRPKITPSYASAQIVPRFLGIVLAILSVILIVQGVKRLRQGDDSTVSEEKTDVVTVVLTFTVIIGYVMILQPLGFCLATVIFLFLQMMVLAPTDKRNPLLFAIISVVFTAFVFVAFRIGLQQLLPRGIIESLLGF